MKRTKTLRAPTQEDCFSMPEVKQALIAIGGSANRIRAAGIDVPLSKSFLPMAGYTTLHWTVSSLLEAGLKSFIFTSDKPQLFDHVRMVLSDLPRPDESIFYLDQGLGTHGLPYQVLRNSDILEKEFLFECGNSVITANHYRRLCHAKRPTNVIFSAFDPHPRNLRQPVGLEPSGRVVCARDTNQRGAIAHPMVIDRAYAAALPRLGFNIHRIIDNYISLDMLHYVKTDLRPEFDFVEEYEDCIRSFYSQRRPATVP
jgi:hypothetical protein